MRRERASWGEWEYFKYSKYSLLNGRFLSDMRLMKTGFSTFFRLFKNPYVQICMNRNLSTIFIKESNASHTCKVLLKTSLVLSLKRLQVSKIQWHLKKKNLPVIVEISIVFAPARFIYFYIAKSQHPLNRCASNCLNKR